MRSRNLYVSDGQTVVSTFTVNGQAPSTDVGAEVKLSSPGNVAVAGTLSAKLAVEGTQSAEKKTTGWNIERARIPGTQSVSVEIVVNGRVVASKALPADGSERKISFDIPIQQSSWVALRLMGAAHTNPVFVLVDNKPIRASRSSVEWNMRSLMEAYEAATASGSGGEEQNVRAAYQYAYAVYQKILTETTAP